MAIDPLARDVKARNQVNRIALGSLTSPTLLNSLGGACGSEPVRTARVHAPLRLGRKDRLGDFLQGGLETRGGTVRRRRGLCR